MFAYLKGILIHAAPGSVILECQGIGYKVFIPANVSSQLPQINESLTLHTSFVVRELSQTLYGFFYMQERDFFESLLGVTGIGPKLALALLGYMPLNDLQHAISSGDAAAICRVPGIGKKGTERLIMEMRDKIDPASLSLEMSAHFVADPHAQAVSDAMSALINLGYNHTIAQKAIKKSLKEIPEAIDLASLISSALKHV